MEIWRLAALSVLVSGSFSLLAWRNGDAGKPTRTGPVSSIPMSSLLRVDENPDKQAAPLPSPRHAAQMIQNDRLSRLERAVRMQENKVLEMRKVSENIKEMDEAVDLENEDQSGKTPEIPGNANESSWEFEDSNLYAAAYREFYKKFEAEFEVEKELLHQMRLKLIEESAVHPE